MTEQTTITTVANEYAEFLRDLHETQLEVKRLSETLFHLEVTIRLCQSNLDISAIKPRRDYRQRVLWLGQGKYTQMALDVLRTTKPLLTYQEISKASDGSLWHPTENKKHLRAVAHTIYVPLLIQKYGVVLSAIDLCGNKLYHKPLT